MDGLLIFMTTESPLRASPKGGWLLAVKVKPGASRNGVEGEAAGRLVVRLQAPPVDGKANAALVEFLADRLGLARSSLTLLKGQSAREKLVHIASIHMDPAMLLPDKK